VTKPPQQLEYAPQAPWHRRRGFRRSIVLIAALLVGLSLWRFGPDAVHRAQLYYWQQQCMQSDLSNVPVFDETRRRSPQLAAAWDKFYALFSPPGARPANTLFLHEMRTTSGEVRLVHVGLGTLASDPEAVTYSSTVLDPGTLFRPPRLVSGGFSTLDSIGSMTIYGASVDPSDPSHFTFVARGSGEKKSFDGWIRGDAIIIQPLDEPDISPALPSSAGATRTTAKSPSR
jgi:hypothetical protein